MSQNVFSPLPALINEQNVFPFLVFITTNPVLFTIIFYFFNFSWLEELPGINLLYNVQFISCSPAHKLGLYQACSHFEIRFTKPRINFLPILTVRVDT